MIKALKENKIKASITVKVVQLGYFIDKKFMNENYRDLVNFAKKSKIFLWLDTVESEYVTPTIELYKTMAKSGNTGIGIQAYLKRSRKDIRALVKQGATIRLVKGAYKDKESISYIGYDAITESYMCLMQYLFEHSKKPFVIASHDPKVIEEAERLEKKYRAKVRYAMLNGIENRYALSIANSGRKIDIYIPFGKRWIEFGINRLSNIHNLILLTRSLFENQKI